MLVKVIVVILGVRLCSWVVDFGFVGDLIFWIDLGDGYSD